jgi:hypothetical protein
MAIQSLPGYATLLLSGYAEKLTPSMLRTEFDDGYIRQDARVSRRRISRRATRRLCSLDAVRDFKCWLRDSLGNGALWFTYADPVEGRQLRARFVNGEFTFTPTAQVQSEGANVWTAACEIESWY